MGVRGLLEYIVSSSHQRRVKLSVLASSFHEETGKCPKLLLDFNDVSSKIWSSPVSVLQNLGDYPTYTSLCGPDFHLVADRARCFVKALRSVGMEPIFFIDKPSYNIKDGRVRQKLKDKRASKLLRCHKINQVLKRTSAQTSLGVMHCHDLKYRQLLFTLKEEGAELIFSTNETVIMTIARYAQTHDDTCGIVSNTTDFALMSGCVLFPLVQFDFDEVTGLSSGVSIVVDPIEIVCMATSSAALAKSLGIRENQLPELAILSGTPHTARFIKRLSVLTSLGLENDGIKDIAAWLKDRDTPLLEHEVMQEILCVHPEFREAIELSFCTFAVQQSSVDPTCAVSPVCDIIEGEITGYCDLAFGAAKHGTIWLNVPYENINLGQPSILTKLFSARKIIYFLLGVNVVHEYERTESQACKKTKVDICSSNDEVTASVERFHLIRGLDRCHKLAMVYNLSTTVTVECLDNVMSVVDDVLKSSVKLPDMEWPKLHKLVFLCSSLRMIGLVNTIAQPTLSISNDQLNALLLASLTCASDGVLLPHIVHDILPSVKGVCIGEWFCEVIDFISQMSYLVGVTEALPEPRNIFYPMAFIPYHLALQTHSNLTARQSADVEYVKAAMDLALSLTSVVEFSRSVFNADDHQTLPDLIVKCDNALEEMLEKKEQLLPRTMTAPLNDIHHENDTSDEESDDGSSSSESEEDNKRKLPRVWEREELPIMEHRDKILELISTHRVVCIEGETGCGKSSQVPQFILSHFPDSKVLVSQPNYLAAKKLAERVRLELEVELPGTSVSHCDDFKTANCYARLIYGTNKFVLKALLNEEVSSSFTHILLDEIHERTTDIDFGLFLAQHLANDRTDLKIVLMSATLQGKLFLKYFRQTLGDVEVPEPYFVGIRRFPVNVFYIDELPELITKKKDLVQSKAMDELAQLHSKLNNDSTLLAHAADVSPYARDICINLILSQPEPGDTVLVFLPGLTDMYDLHSTLLRKMRRLGVAERFRVFIFHNQLPIEDEKEAFEKPKDGHANVIISHTLAESSITFPHLKFVINFCIRRYMIYDPNTGISKLCRKWCSKASCIQREGRVGRISEGTAIHLIMKEDYNKLADFNIPEIIFAPLSKTVLQAKQLINDGCDVSPPSKLLSFLIEPPSLLHFEAALNELVEIGAILYDPQQCPVREEAEVTLLGEFSLGLPLDLNLCRFILLGILLGCPNDAVVLAASMSMYQDIFTLPTRTLIHDMRMFCESLARSTFSRLSLDAGSYSKPIMIRNMYLKWLRFLGSSRSGDRRNCANKFSFQCAVRVQRLLHFDTSVADIARAVAAWLPPDSKAGVELSALSCIDRGRPPTPVMSSNTYFTDDTVHTFSNTARYVPPHLRNLSFQKTYGTTRELHFCNNNLVLKMLITAASPNEIIYGKRMTESFYTFQRAFARRCVRIAKEENFYPSKTLCMNLTDVSEIDLWAEQLDETNETTIHELYNSLPEGFHFPFDVKVEKETKTVIINFQSSSNDLRNITGIANAMGYDHSRCPVDASTAELSSPSLELQLLWRLSEYKEEWDVEDVNAIFSYLYHPHKFVWVMLDKHRLPVSTALLNYRNPTGFMCLFKEPEYPYFAVSTGSFVNQDDIVLCTDITLLPPPPQSLMMILATQLPTSVTELLIDKEEHKVKGIRLNSNEIVCKNIDRYITIEKLEKLNQFRRLLSSALSSSLYKKQIHLEELRVSEIQSSLTELLAPLSDDTSHQPSSSSSSTTSDPERLVWEMITPGRLLDKSQASQIYYPELKSTLLGTEPYNMTVTPSKHASDVSTTPTINYKESAATKLLLDNFVSIGSLELSNDIEVYFGSFSESGWFIAQPKEKIKKKVHKDEAIPVTSEQPDVVHEKDNSSMDGSSAAYDDGKSKEDCSLESVKKLSFPERIAAKLEQEIVRHLQRNNKMEFLSELRVQRRVKHICSLITTTLNVPFFLQRPNVFQVQEVEPGQEGPDASTEGREYLIVLDQSKWQDVDSEEEEPVLPPSMRIIRRAQRARANVPIQSSSYASSGSVVTEGTQTDVVPLSDTNELKMKQEPVRDNAASKETKSSPSKPLTATKTVKLTETRSNSPHTSYTVEGSSKSNNVASKKVEQTKPSTVPKTTAHTEVTTAASKASAKKTTAASSKKKGPAPGSDDHLAIYIYDYIKRYGGVVKLNFLRNKAYPEYYDRYSSQRYSGYHYLRKSLILSYPGYFEVFKENKVFYVRALDEEQVVESHHDDTKATSATHDTKQHEKKSKQVKGKEVANSAKKTTEHLPSTQKTGPVSETHPTIQKGEKRNAPEKVQVVTLRSSPKAVPQESSKAEPAVQFVHIPSSSGHSQELTDDQLSITVPSTTQSHSLSQTKSKTPKNNHPTVSSLVSGAGTVHKQPLLQPIADQCGHTEPVPSQMQPLKVTSVTHADTSQAQVIHPAKQPTVNAMTSASKKKQPVKSNASSSHSQQGKMQAQAGDNEDVWHSSEDSWLSEDEFDPPPPGSPSHIAKYLHRHLNATKRSYPFGCTISELDRYYQKEYKKHYPSKKVTKITSGLLNSFPTLFKLSNDVFLKLKDGAYSRVLRGRPYTPEHIADYFTNYLGKGGVVCSLTEAQDIFDRKYKVEFTMPVNPLIWFLSENFFEQSHQFIVFSDVIVTI